MLRRLAQLAFAARCPLDDAQAPVALGANKHLPVMPAPGEALVGQDAVAGVKALRIAVPALIETTLHNRVSLGQLQ